MLLPFYEHGGLERKHKPIHAKIIEHLLDESSGSTTEALVQAAAQNMSDGTREDLIERARVLARHELGSRKPEPRLPEHRFFSKALTDFIVNETRSLCSAGAVEERNGRWYIKSNKRAVLLAYLKDK